MESYSLVPGTIFVVVDPYNVCTESSTSDVIMQVDEFTYSNLSTADAFMQVDDSTADMLMQVDDSTSDTFMQVDNSTVDTFVKAKTHPQVNTTTRYSFGLNASSGPLRTISTYGIDQDTIDFIPELGIPYVIGLSGQISRLNDPIHKIGFNIIQENGRVYYRIMQVGFYSVEIQVEIIGLVNCETLVQEDNSVSSGVLHFY
jgi:hypothetical protein